MKNPSTLERGDLFSGELQSLERTMRAGTWATIDGYQFQAYEPDKIPKVAGAKGWHAPGKLVVFEYTGFDSPRNTVRSDRPRITLRAIIDPRDDTYDHWSGRTEEQLARAINDAKNEQRGHYEKPVKGYYNPSNPALPPFEPVEVEQIRADMQAAIGEVAERYGLRVQYSELAPTEKVIPVGFKIYRRAPEQRDLFGNPGHPPSRESNPRQGRIGRRISGT